MKVPDIGWPSTDFQTQLNHWVRNNAHAVDVGNVEAREALPLLAGSGFLSLGAPLNAGGALLNQAAVIQVLARHSFSTAFALWGHRMCIEFLEVAVSPTQCCLGYMLARLPGCLRWHRDTKPYRESVIWN